MPSETEHSVALLPKTEEEGNDSPDENENDDSKFIDPEKLVTPFLSCPVRTFHKCMYIGVISALINVILLVIPVNGNTKTSSSAGFSLSTSGIDVAVVSAFGTIFIALFYTASRWDNWKEINMKKTAATFVYSTYTATFFLCLILGKLFVFDWRVSFESSSSSSLLDGIVVIIACLATLLQVVLSFAATSWEFAEGGAFSQTDVLWKVVKPFLILPAGAETKAKLASVLMWIVLVIAQACVLLAPLQLAHVVDLLTSYQPSSSSSSSDVDDSDKKKTVILAVLLWAGLRLAPKLLREARDLLYTYTWHIAFEETLVNIVFKHLFSLPHDFFQRSKIGATIESINSGIDAADKLVYSLVITLIPALVSTIAAFVIMTEHLNLPIIAGVSFVGFAVYIWATLVMTFLRKEERDEMAEALNAQRSHIADSLVNFEALLQFGPSAMENRAKEFSRVVDEYRKCYVRVRYSHSSIDVTQSITSNLTRFVVILLAGLAVVLPSFASKMTNRNNTSGVSVADFVALVSYLDALFEPLEKLGMTFMEIVAALIDLSDIVQLLSERPEPSDKKDAITIQELISMKKQEQQNQESHQHQHQQIQISTTTASSQLVSTTSSSSTYLPLEFKNVNFAYPSSPEQLILHDFSFKFQPGTSVAIVGASGSSKTTLFRLLLRLYELYDTTDNDGDNNNNNNNNNSSNLSHQDEKKPKKVEQEGEDHDSNSTSTSSSSHAAVVVASHLNSGEITLGGVPIQSITRRSLRDSIAVVPQDSAILFNDTVENNVKFAKPNATPEELCDAMLRAELGPLVCEKLGKKLKTNLGERGGRLSGGERSRVALARALLKFPTSQLLLVDEGTASLDNITELKIKNALSQFHKNTGKICLIIAHRLSSVVECDTILVMRGGKLVQCGSHSELLQDEKSYYYALWHQQLEQENEEEEEEEGEGDDDQNEEEEEKSENNIRKREKKEKKGGSGKSENKKTQQKEKENSK